MIDTNDMEPDEHRGKIFQAYCPICETWDYRSKRGGVCDSCESDLPEHAEVADVPNPIDSRLMGRIVDDTHAHDGKSHAIRSKPITADEEYRLSIRIAEMCRLFRSRPGANPASSRLCSAYSRIGAEVPAASESSVHDGLCRKKAQRG